MEQVQDKNNFLGFIDKKDNQLEKERQLKNKEQIILNRNNLKEMKKKNRRLLVRGNYLEEILQVGEEWTDEDLIVLLKRLADSETYHNFLEEKRITGKP
ncbi:MAG: hypothetical protein KA080_00615 [Leptotrichiaceae bacterium]|nr:hypothetical protein [Leptotrichiaceae bacterium]